MKGSRSRPCACLQLLMWNHVLGGAHWERTEEGDLLNDSVASTGIAWGVGLEVHFVLTESLQRTVPCRT